MAPLRPTLLAAPSVVALLLVPGGLGQAAPGPPPVRSPLGQGAPAGTVAEPASSEGASPAPPVPAQPPPADVPALDTRSPGQAARDEASGAQPSGAGASRDGSPPGGASSPTTAPAAAAATGPPKAGPPLLRPEPLNRVSLFGAQALGAGSRAVSVYLGFPLLGARGAVGVTPWLDAGLAFESFYGVMNEVRGYARVNVLASGRWDVALAVEGGRAFFLQKAQVEHRGARWLTGRRNWNLAPGLVVSLRGGNASAPRLYADVRYHLAVDLERYQRSPLGGIPEPVALFHNLPVRFGAELPFSPVTSFLTQFGLDLHGSPDDSAFMPVIGVGVVTAL
jgi:hypothetical protein